jgi:hypothetical protein
MESPKSEICVICGKTKACSRDHIPPKCIFPKPRPIDLITVPACSACNMKQSGLDEQFKVFVGITVGYNLDGDKSYRQPVLRTLGHNRKLRSEIISSMRHIIVQDPSRTIRQPAYAIPIKKEAHDTVIERIVRGLYFHHTGVFLGDRYHPNVDWHFSINDELFEIANDWNTGTVGDPAFVYKYVIAADDPSATAWILQFFQKTWSSVIFSPEESDIEPGV